MVPEQVLHSVRLRGEKGAVIPQEVESASAWPRLVLQPARKYPAILLGLARVQHCGPHSVLVCQQDSMRIRVVRVDDGLVGRSIDVQCGLRQRERKPALPT